MQIVVNKQIINYEQISSGHKPLIVLHGWGRSLAEWRFLADEVNLLDNYSIYLIDLPGFGQSPIPNKALSIFDYADFVKKFCDKLNLKSISIIGHSLGGRIAIILASQYPNFINKLILIDNGGIERKSLLIWIKILIAKILKPFKLLIPKSLINKFKSSDYQSVSNPIVKQTFVNIINTDLLHLAQNIINPVLIIWGINDKTLPVKHARIWRDHLQDARLRIAWDSGHSPHMDEPGFVTDLITDFLADNK